MTMQNGQTPTIPDCFFFFFFFFLYNIWLDVFVEISNCQYNSFCCEEIRKYFNMLGLHVFKLDNGHYSQCMLHLSFFLQKIRLKKKKKKKKKRKRNNDNNIIKQNKRIQIRLRANFADSD